MEGYEVFSMADGWSFIVDLKDKQSTSIINKTRTATSMP